MISGDSVHNGGYRIYDNEFSDSINGREFHDRLRSHRGGLLGGSGCIFESEK
jgi:hypothetical protein